MRLIDADAYIDEINKRIKEAHSWYDEVQTDEMKVRAEQAIATFCEASLTAKKMPSAEPRIIYCKDCKHMIINEKHEAKPMICCFTKMCGTTEPDWFCADGERREDGLN